MGKRISCVLFTAMAVGLAWAGSASAGSIGVQFTGNTGNGSATPVALTASQVAGVVPQANYNVFAGNSATNVILRDNNNVFTTTGLSLDTAGATGYTTSGVQPVTPDEILNHGIINGTTGTAPTITLTNIPYAAYDLIVYTLDDAARSQRISATTSAGTTSFTVRSPNGNAAGYQDSNAGTAFTYIQGTTNSLTPVANSNYVRFTNLTSPDVTITADARIATFATGTTNGNNNAFINGLQIVEVPEPASLSLLTLAGAGFLSRRRRATR